MGRAAAENADRPLLKLKMTGDGQDLDRVARIHASAPSARLVVDANEAWDVATYRDLAPRMAGLGVEMIEQPLPAKDDAGLPGLDRPVPLCADESCHERSEEHTSELQSLMRTSYAVCCLKKKRIHSVTPLTLMNRNMD